MAQDDSPGELLALTEWALLAAAEWAPSDPTVPRPVRGDVYEVKTSHGGRYKLKVYDVFSARDADGKSVLAICGFRVNDGTTPTGGGGRSRLLMVFAGEVIRRVSEGR